MDIFTPPGLLRAGDKLEELTSKFVMEDITVVNPAATRCLEKSAAEPRSAPVERATIKAKNTMRVLLTRLRSTLFTTVGFSTCGGFGKGTNEFFVGFRQSSGPVSL